MIPSTSVIADLFRAGMTYQQISEQYGVSHQAVRQRLKRAHIDADEGGQAVKSRLRAEKRRAAFRKKFGCSREQFKLYCEMGMRSPFKEQKSNTKYNREGIEWKLTFGEWAAIWILSGKWNERGRNSGQYVMARFGDRGAYCWDNVEIVTCNENVSLIRAREAIALVVS